MKYCSLFSQGRLLDVESFQISSLQCQLLSIPQCSLTKEKKKKPAKGKNKICGLRFWRIKL